VLAVDGVEDGAFRAFGGVPAGVPVGGGVGGCGVEDAGGRREGGGRGGRRGVGADGVHGAGWRGRGVKVRAAVGRGRNAGDEPLGAGLVGRIDLVEYRLSVKGMDGAAEPAVPVPVEPDGLSDLDEGDGGAGVRQGAAEVVCGGVAFHGGPGGLHGGGACGDGGVGVEVVPDVKAGRSTGDGGRGGDAVGAKGVVAGFVGHVEGEVAGEVGRFGQDAGVAVADGATVAFASADALGGLRRDGRLFPGRPRWRARRGRGWRR